MASIDLCDLLPGLASGDPAATEEFATAARPHLLRMARAILRDAALAEDVAQESLLEVLATHAALRNPAAATTWLRLIVRKQADRATRRLRTAEPLFDEHRQGGDGPEDLVERLGDVATIRRALAVAADGDQLLLRLRYVGEWSDRELADLLGITTGAVRKRLHDSRRRLRRVIERSPAASPDRTERSPMPTPTPTPDVRHLLGRVVPPREVPPCDATVGSAGGSRLETGLRILDAVVPIERGGTVDLLGPEGLGQLVLVVELARAAGAVIVAAGASPSFAGLVAEDAAGARALVVDGSAADASTAAGDAARALAASGEAVLLVLDADAWAAGPPPPSGEVGAGSITAFRFAPHPRDATPTPPLEVAGTALVFATEPFVAGRYPAIDPLASRSRLVDDDRLDPVTVATARAARSALARAHAIHRYLAQPLAVAEPFTGIPGETTDARSATEGLASLTR